MLFPDEHELIHRIALALIRRKERLGTAESCTGGLIAAACTELPGSSQWFERGVVSYTNQAKTELLGVPPGLIETFGAVSGEVVGHMARGLMAHAPVEWAIAVTGIAGPTGGSAEKPVGMVCFGLSRSGEILTRTQQFGDIGRDAVRDKSVAYALQWAIEILS